MKWYRSATAAPAQHWGRLSASPDLMLPSSRQMPFQRLYRDELCMLSLTCFTSSCFCLIFSQFLTRNTWCLSTKFLKQLGSCSRRAFYWKMSSLIQRCTLGLLTQPGWEGRIKSCILRNSRMLHFIEEDSTPFLRQIPLNQSLPFPVRHGLHLQLRCQPGWGVHTFTGLLRDVAPLENRLL